MDKPEIIAEVHRLTEENGGVPVGQTRFFAETGIRPHEVIGKLWSRWSDVLVEAGLEANEWNGPMDENILLGHYAALARKLGKLPTNTDIGVEQGMNPGFPSKTTYTRRFGTKAQTIEKVRAWCEANPGNNDVLALCPGQSPGEATTEKVGVPSHIGFVYLVKSGRHYKIGRSNDAGRRNYEIRLQQPQPVEEVWKIKTDDPTGVELYWHRRFADRRLNGEWFDLRKSEVDAFKRWRRIA
ncbi:MAG: GIY-YIG nuclease family protein [Acidimicrobiales bacterium]